MDKLRNIPLVLLFAHAGKLLILQPNLADAPILAILALLAAYYDYASTKDQLKEIRDELKEFKSSVSELTRRNDELKNSVAGLKLSNTYNKTGPTRI